MGRTGLVRGAPLRVRSDAVQVPAPVLLPAETGGLHVVAVAAAAERDYVVAERKQHMFAQVLVSA